AILFGIEDLTAEFIKKRQKPEITAPLFPMKNQHKNLPMAILVFPEGQPFESGDGLYGIGKHIVFFCKTRAMSLQVTLHTPAVGTREWERTFETGRVMKTLGDYRTSFNEGNHVTMVGKTPGWLKQLQLLGAYFRFYNPLNLFRSLRDDGSPL